MVNRFTTDVCDIGAHAVDPFDVGPPAKVDELYVGCDVVYHCAALAYEGLSVFSPALITRNIMVGTANVAAAAIRAGVKRFINCSSMARYGPAPLPFHEDGYTRPADPYGIAKLAAEHMLNVLGSAHGMKVIHAVPHNIYGPRQKYDDPFRNVAAIFVNAMLRNISPVIYGDGQQQRSFSFISDVLPALLAMVDADLPHGDVINIGPDETQAVTVGDLYAMVATATGYSGAPRYLPGRPCEVKAAYCSADKARRLFGCEPRTTLQAGIKQLVAWVQAKGPRPFKAHLPVEIVTPALPKTWGDSGYDTA